MKNIKTYFFDERKLPLVIEPRNPSLTFTDFLELLKSNQPFFNDALLLYGGILFRGFPINGEKTFEEAIETLGLGQFLNYVGGDSPRKKLSSGVYTSTEAPPYIKIPLHNELSFVRDFPKHIYFYCQTAPKADGETIIADARKIYQAIDPKIKEEFEKKKITYVSRYPSKHSLINRINPYHKSWMEVFETENKKDVERLCQEHEFQCQWKKNDWLEMEQRGPASLTHPITKEKVWFNQAHIFNFTPYFLGWLKYLGIKLLYFQKSTRLHEAFFQDGTKIPFSTLKYLLTIFEENTIRFAWKEGDMLVLDNILAMHGRAPFEGKRRILAAMTGEEAPLIPKPFSFQKSTLSHTVKT